VEVQVAPHPTTLARVSTTTQCAAQLMSLALPTLTARLVSSSQVSANIFVYSNHTSYSPVGPCLCCQLQLCLRRHRPARPLLCYSGCEFSSRAGVEILLDQEPMLTFRISWAKLFCARPPLASRAKSSLNNSGNEALFMSDDKSSPLLSFLKRGSITFCQIANSK